MSVTLKDIAQELGVSTATISKAINNRPGVSDELRKKIFQMIEEKDLRPKQRVGGFKKDDTMYINLLVRINQSLQSDPFNSLITEGILKELQNFKGSIQHFVLHENNISDQTFVEMFENKPVDGSILVGADYNPELFHKIQQLNIPVVLVDNEYAGFSFVNTDNIRGALDAVKHLAELGHKDILFLSGPLGHKSIAQRYEGYCRGLKQYTGRSKPALIECPGVGVDDGFHAVDQYGEPDFSAIFAANDKLAIGALKALKQKGYNVPQDFSIVGFDDIEWSLHTEPPLTTVKIAKHQMGALAAQLLLNLYSNKDMHQVDVKVTTNLIVRESTGPVKA